jgi:O-antigen biosynthesis protein
MNQLPSVTVIVLNWNGRAYLPDCLSALLAVDYPDYRVTVVDNASSDDSVAWVRERYPQVEVIENQQNLGFAGGNNVALRRLATDYAVLLNPDVIVSRHWLRHLLRPMIADPTIGIAGCKLTFPNGRIQHAGGFITAPQALPGHFGLNEVDEGQYDQAGDVEYVTGAALALTRPLLDTIGLLDEGYFLYYEEVDFCWRARQAGFRVVYVPQATAVHDESALSVRGSLAYLERMHSGRWRFLLKQFELDTLLNETLAAEREWLARIAGPEAEVMQRVYRQAIANLEEIWSARSRHGNFTIMLASKLEALAATAVPESAYAKDSYGETTARAALLQQKWHVREQPFISKVPGLGSLVVAGRTLWNNMAAKWYLRALVQQQNEFNFLLVQALQQRQEQLIQQDRRQAQLADDTAELTRQLIRMNRLLKTIDERLAKLQALDRRLI